MPIIFGVATAIGIAILFTLMAGLFKAYSAFVDAFRKYAYGNTSPYNRETLLQSIGHVTRMVLLTISYLAIVLNITVVILGTNIS